MCRKFAGYAGRKKLTLQFVQPCRDFLIERGNVSTSFRFDLKGRSPGHFGNPAGNFLGASRGPVSRPMIDIPQLNLNK
jgi:hypothetical protein